jgi:hypothetical protein
MFSSKIIFFSGRNMRFMRKQGHLRYDHTEQLQAIWRQKPGLGTRARSGYCGNANKRAWTLNRSEQLCYFYGKKSSTSLGCYFSGPSFPIYHPRPLLFLFNVEPHPYFRWLCPSLHIGGMFTFHSVIFESYSTVVYFSNVSEGSFWSSGSGDLTSFLLLLCKDAHKWFLCATYVARRNGEMTSMWLKKERHSQTDVTLIRDDPHTIRRQINKWEIFCKILH